MDPRTERYRNALAAARDLLWDLDPEQFADAGAPPDEYDSAAERLVIDILKVPPGSLDQWADWFPEAQFGTFAVRVAELRERFTQPS